MKNLLVSCVLAVVVLTAGCGADDGDQYKSPYDGGIEIVFSCVGCDVADLVITVYFSEGEFLTQLENGEDTVYLEYLDWGEGSYYVTFADQNGNPPYDFSLSGECAVPTAGEWRYTPRVDSPVRDVGMSVWECLPDGVEAETGFRLSICPVDGCGV